MRSKRGIFLLFLAGATIYGVATMVRSGVPGMVFDLIRRELGLTAAQTSGIASWRTLGSMSFVGFSGFLIDRCGWRRLVLAGAAMQLAGYLLIGGGAGAAELYGGAFVNGAGMTIVYLSLLKLLDAEFEPRLFAVLLGLFYIFSYGGTCLGTAPFARMLDYWPWQRLLSAAAVVTALLMAAIALLMLTEKRGAATKTAPRTIRRIPWSDLARNLRKPPCLAVFLVTASSLGIYWSMLAGTAGKYLADIGGGTGALAVMNLIVMAEMIFGGSISFLFGNRRKCFQAAGAILNALAILLLFAGTFLSGAAASGCAWTAMIALGAGYGCTCINITAVREFVPPELAASVIGLENFVGDTLIITLSQLSGAVFDRWRVADGLNVEPAGYRVLLIVYGVLALAAVPTALRLRDTRGRNISAEL